MRLVLATLGREAPQVVDFVRPKPETRSEQRELLVEVNMSEAPLLASQIRVEAVTPKGHHQLGLLTCSQSSATVIG